MEDNKKELAYWTINHFQKKLQIVEQRWNIFEKQPFFDYKVNIKIKNKNFVGRGTNISQQDALESAIGEALERYAINFNEIKSSNGCAFHTNLKSAITNANNEILERHYAMLFTLGYWDQEKVDESDYPQEIKKILIILENLGIKIEFYSLKKLESHQIILCQANGLKSKKPFGLIFGSSCSSLQKQSIEKSFKEVLINIVAYFNNNLNSISYEQFLSYKFHTPVNHLQLYLNLSFAKRYLKHRTFKKSLHKSPDLGLFSNDYLKYPYDSIYSVIRSTHPECLPPQWGPSITSSLIKNINIDFPFVLP